MLATAMLATVMLITVVLATVMLATMMLATVMLATVVQGQDLPPQCKLLGAVFTNYGAALCQPVLCCDHQVQSQSYLAVCENNVTTR